MAAPARILLVTVGSLGDLHPYLALGQALLRRGHRPLIGSVPGYAARAAAAGLEFRPLRPHIDVEDPAELERAMDPRTGSKYVLADMALGRLGESFDDLRQALGDVDLLVGHPIAFAALLLGRASRRPWASVALAPVSLFSALDPPVFRSGGLAEFLARRGPRFQRALLRLFDLSTRPWLRPYRALERQLGLAPGPNPIFRGQHSPYLNLALFSSVLAAPQADWPARTVQTGFPFYPHDDAAVPEVERFLDAGAAPIVFTLGSAAVGRAGDFYEQSALAAERLGRRALLLIGKDPRNRPRRALPPGVLAVPYAPHASVFPRAAAIVHQGGIGTTAEALRSGRPALIVPWAHDQPDQAARLARAGLARRLPRPRYRADAAASELRALLDDAALRERCAAAGARVRAEDGLGAACKALETLMEARES